jgi:hypothetical protein
MQVIGHKSWGGYPGGRMLKILFRKKMLDEVFVALKS